MGLSVSNPHTCGGHVLARIHEKAKSSPVTVVSAESLDVPESRIPHEIQHIVGKTGQKMENRGAPCRANRSARLHLGVPSSGLAVSEQQS